MKTLKKRSLFWDADVKDIDVRKNAVYIVERVLDFGSDEDVRWLWRFYKPAFIKKVVVRSRSLHSKTKNLWRILLEKN